MSFKIIIDCEPTDNGHDIEMGVSDNSIAFYRIIQILRAQADVLEENLLAAAWRDKNIMSIVSEKKSMETFSWRDFVAMAATKLENNQKNNQGIRD